MSHHISSSTLLKAFMAELPEPDITEEDRILLLDCEDEKDETETYVDVIFRLNRGASD